MTTCLVDFNGYTSPSHFPVAFWADYDHAARLVIFGGDWREVPPVYSPTLPSESEVEHLESYAEWFLSN